MFFDIALTAGATFPLYLGTIVVLNRQSHKAFTRLMYLFVLGALSTLPLLVMRVFQLDQAVFQLFFGPLISILVLAFLEELLKSFFLLLRKEFRLSYAYPVVIGIGFAFAENVSYLFDLKISGAFWTVAIIRLLLDSTAHAVFTCVMAMFMRKATKTSRTYYYVAGLLVSGSFHAFFNLLHHWEMNYLVVPLLAILIAWIHSESSEARHMHGEHVRHSVHQWIPFGLPKPHT